MSENVVLAESIRKRWSPTKFAEQPVSAAALRSVFEAAAWAASSFNEQPWRFLVASKDQPDQFDRMLGLLVPKNQEWARSAWALGISAGKKTFSHNGTPNRFGLHDTGAALANLMIQATELGLHVHGMGGFDTARTRMEFGIPEDFEIGAAFAIGYVDGADDPPVTRSRRPLTQTVFSEVWAQPAFKS